MWKNIDFACGKYSVSDKGQIRNNKTGKILKPVKTHNGYLRVGIFDKLYRVHRLVANEFLENPKNLPQINHIDGNKENNNLNNLEWCSEKENIQHSYKIGKRKISYKNIIQPKKIVQLDLKNNIINEYDCIMDVQRKYGFDNSAISKVCRGKQKTAYDYKWQYAT